jgi:hypothetical protein
MDAQTVVIVSGLPRSGTSLMMGMLEAGGIPVLTDRQRAADEDNPRGYYELERVKQIKDTPAFLDEARGKVVKIISELLRQVPPHYPCRVIFMQRHMSEILASQRQMLVRRGKPADAAGDAEMAALFEQHLRRVEQWLAQQPHMQVLYVNYNDLLADPTPQIAAINRFLGGELDTAAMAAAIDPALYRQRQ